MPICFALPLINLCSLHFISFASRLLRSSGSLPSSLKYPFCPIQVDAFGDQLLNDPSHAAHLRTKSHDHSVWRTKQRSTAFQLGFIKNVLF
jgi:hypothetical protein